VGPNYSTPRSDVAPSYLPSPGVEETPLNAADAYWWKIFQDPVLDRLVDAAYRNNLTLQIAGARVLQARAQLNQSIGNLFPQQQGASGAIAYDRTGTPITINRWDDNLLFSATWEIDVWGKIRRGIEADRAAYLSSVATYDDALVTVIADVASSYVNVRTAEERLRVAARNVATQKESLRIASVQFKYGETSELDVRQAATLLGQTLQRLEVVVGRAGAAVQADEREAAGHVLADRAVPGLVPAERDDALLDLHASVSASTKARKTMLITPLTVKKAASRRRRSSGRTMRCS